MRRGIEGCPTDPKSIPVTIMNRDFVEFQLTEASLHLQDLVLKFRNGTIGEADEPCLAVSLGHVLGHLCMTWNAKHQSIEDVASVSQNEFGRLCNTVPNFLGEKILGDFAA